MTFIPPIVPLNKKKEYWDYFTKPESKELSTIPFGYSSSLCDKAGTFLFAANPEAEGFWYDIITRQEGLTMTPVEMREKHPRLFEETRKVFWGKLTRYMALYGVTSPMGHLHHSS